MKFYLQGRIARQVSALVQKNFLIFYKAWFSTLIRALVFPVAVSLVLVYCKEIFNTDNYIYKTVSGIATSSLPLHDLADAIGASDSQKLVFARNGFSSSDVDSIINGVFGQQGMSRFPHAIVDDVDDLFDECKQTLEGTSDCFAAIVFTTFNSTNAEYVIALDDSLDSSGQGSYAHTGIITDRLLPLQWAVESHVGNFSSSPRPAELPWVGDFANIYPRYSSSYDYSDYETNFWYQLISQIVSPIFMLLMMGVVYHLALLVASERQSGMSELLAVQTCTTLPRMLSTYLSFVLLYGPGWITCGALLGGLLFLHISTILVVFMHILAGLSITASTHTVASVFRKAQLSGLWTSVLMFALAFVTLANLLTGFPSVSAIYALNAVFPPITYSTMISDMARGEAQKTGFTLGPPLPLPVEGSDSVSDNVYPQFAGYFYVIFFVLQAILYAGAAYGLEQWLWGVTKKFGTIESSSDTAVRCTGLSKTFKAKHGQLRAVDDLNLDIKKSSVVFLLGPNGGGKTTTLKCIAGMHAMDAGSKLEINEDHLAFGVCPQGNIFWDNLTVAEHIRIFKKIKTAAAGSNTYDDDVLVECDLLEKQGSRANTLSGGQMRKLQLAIAFVGGSKMCFIDEATSGVDPLSRQNIWTIIAKGHSRRTILMTTHFLDEADILSDHIAIVYKGKLVCDGSSTLLKAAYGDRYVVKEIQTKSTDHQPQMWQMASSAEAASKVVELERASSSSYSVEFPTLDQVFLKVTNSTLQAPVLQREATSTDASEEPGQNHHSPIQQSIELEIGKSAGFLRQIVVILKKRYLLLQRNWFSFLIALATPIIIAAVLNHFLFALDPFTPCSQNRQALIDSSQTNPSSSRGSAIHLAPLKVPYSYSTSDISYALNSSVLGPAEAFEGTAQDSIYLASIASTYDPTRTGYYSTQSNPLKTRDLNSTSLNGVITRIGQAGGRVGFGIWEDSPTNITLLHDSHPNYAIAGLSYITNRLANSSAQQQGAMAARLVTVEYQLFRHASTSVPWLALPYSIFILLGMVTSATVAVLYPVYERLNNARSLQYCNGVSPAALWIAYLIFEMQIAIVTSVITWALVFGVPDAKPFFFEPNYLVGVFILFFLATYLGLFVISHIIKKAAFAIAIALHLLLAVLYVVGYVLNQAFGPGNKKGDIYLALQAGVGLTSPAANLARALFVSVNSFDTTCGPTGYEIYSPGSYQLYGGAYCNLMLQIIFLSGVLLLIEYGSSEWWAAIFFYVRRHKKSSSPSSGKLQEEGSSEHIAIEKSASTSADLVTSDMLCAHQVTKAFGKNVAASNVSFSVRSGTTLGLLGPNGAGKTTMINMIRGLIKPDSGTIHIDGTDVAMHPQQARMHVGVCPQDDAIDEMTVMQTMTFYAAMKGLKDSRAEALKVLTALGIQSFASVRINKLSGGTRRKLMVCISLLGNPRVLLLDEPSTGQDAGAKRILWDVLGKFQSDRAILLTTHSMEEVEALASHVAILGTKMLATGTLVQLRNEYGGFYRIRATYDETAYPANSIETMIREKFEDSTSSIIAGFGEVEFQLPHEARKLGWIMSTMEELKGVSPTDVDGSVQNEHSTGVLRDYTVMEPDMTEVFMSVCRRAKLLAV